MNRVGMTRKQLQRMFLAEGIFTWLLLSVLILTVGTILPVSYTHLDVYKRQG